MALISRRLMDETQWMQRPISARWRRSGATQAEAQFDATEINLATPASNPGVGRIPIVHRRRMALFPDPLVQGLSVRPACVSSRAMLLPCRWGTYAMTRTEATRILRIVFLLWLVVSVALILAAAVTRMSWPQSGNKAPEARLLPSRFEALHETLTAQLSPVPSPGPR